MKQLLSSLLLMTVLSVHAQQNDVPVQANTFPTVKSPTSGLTAAFTIADGVPFLVMKDAAGTQVAQARLGIKTSGEDYATGLIFVGATPSETIREEYHALHGKRSSVSNTANRIVLTLANAERQNLQVEVRAYEDGIVFRYLLPGEDTRQRTFTSELTSYEIPAEAHRWLHSFNTSYEADFPYQPGAGRPGRGAIRLSSRTLAPSSLSPRRISDAPTAPPTSTTAPTPTTTNSPTPSTTKAMAREP